MASIVVTAVERGGGGRPRTLDERLMVRFPGAYRVLTALLLRTLDPRSRPRRALLRRHLASAYAAASRRDFELMLVRYSPEVEVEFEPDLEALGISGTFHGHEGLLQVIEAFGEAWEQWELLPSAVVDLGDHVLGLGHFRLPGTASGIEFEREFAHVITVRRGLVRYEREFLSWEKGLRAAGLDPTLLALPARQ